MPYMMARGVVEDFATFKSTFDGAEAFRKEAGALGSRVFQSADDPNEIIIEIEFPTVEAAKAFASSPKLRETQQRAGAKEPPKTLVVSEV